MNIIISDDTEERFRKAVSNSKGMKKGNISIAIEEAIDYGLKSKNAMNAVRGRDSMAFHIVTSPTVIYYLLPWQC